MRSADLERSTPAPQNLVASHPRLVAFALALLVGTVLNIGAAVMFAARGGPLEGSARTEWIAVVGALVASLLFGAWIRRRDEAAWQRAVASGIVCPMLTLVIAGGFFVLEGRTERALAHGLTFGSAPYFDFVFEGLGPLHIAGQILLGALGSIVVGSVMTAFLPEIIGGFAGHCLWTWAGRHAAGRPPSDADSRPA